MLHRMLSVFKDKRGVSALEYAILAAVVVVGLTAAVGSTNGTSGISAVLNKAFNRVSNAVPAG